MKIVRGGKEIELTPQELRLAHDEYQHTLDEYDIKDRFDQLDDDEFEETFRVAKVCLGDEIKSEMAQRMRRYIDKYDMSWEYARDEAITDAICEWKARG